MPRAPQTVLWCEGSDDTDEDPAAVRTGSDVKVLLPFNNLAHTQTHTQTH